jgi:L-asparaginase II
VTAILDLAGTVELARVERSGMIESRHLGAAALVDRSGSVVRSLGNADSLVYPRSTLKPIQALTSLEAGAPLVGVQIAIAAASHAGSPEHVAVIRGILDAAGLDETALQCPVDWPLDSRFRSALQRDGTEPSRLTMNCSGKHAAFLSASVANGWSIDDYLDLAHPVQVMVRNNVEKLAGEAIEHSGVDGCGAPVHALTLAGLARATGRITGATSGAALRLSTAIRKDPWAIDGHGRANTVVIEQLGLIAKLGAEGVLVMGAPNGSAVAVKILDGSLRAATLVALELLIRQGLVSRDAARPVLEATTERVLGGGHPVGALLVSF